MCDPLDTPPPEMPHVVLRGELYLAMSIPRRIRRHVPKFRASRSSRLTASTDFWICDTLKKTKMPPGILKGELYLAYVHSQMNPHTCTTFGANQSSCLTAYPDLWICDPRPKTPGVLRGALYLAYVHSQKNPHICTEFGANRSSRLTASPNIWICYP